MLNNKRFRFIPIGIIGLTSLVSPVFGQFSDDLPEEYYPNYHIQEEYDQLLEYIIDIQATSKVGSDLEEDVFRDMNDIFDVIFEYFPQSSTNEVIYRQCEIITRELGNSVSRAKYVTFKERCFEPLGTIIRDINTKYVVKADIKASPKKGSSPLNVTLDARDSVDPSNDTIPSNNFYRWYKDIHGVEQVIGRGPVVNYTFRDPGNHIVHLTVRSSNNYVEGIFDGEKSISINVAPKAANMVVYISGQKATEERLLKIGSQDAQRGLLIDATATVPIGARTIAEHKWTIKGSSDTKYEFTESGTGSPGQFIHIFPRNGVYTIVLEILDNEGNRLKETYQVSISDPVATIKSKPAKGTTSTEFTFDASASYSITSRIKKYQWIVTDPEGNQIDQVESKELKRGFTKPGTYSVKLTVTDETGSSSFDIQQLYVASTPPEPSFLIEPQADWKYPSQFILDASGTFDEDVRAGTDELTYNWSFSNSKNVAIERNLEEDGSKVRIVMEQPGTYKVKLTVEDTFGERVSVEREIKVESTLRPQVVITPQVGVWGEEITFYANVNKNVAFYEWDFGDGKKQQSRDPKVTHIYQKAGDYEVTVKVITETSETNEITTSVFMGQKDMPVPAYTIKGAANTTLQKDDSCQLFGETHEAFRVSRYQNIIIDATKSTNAQGLTNDLAVAFRPLNDEVYNKNNLSYIFTEIGCTYVDLFVEDSNLGKTESTRIWFDVVNAAPILQNLTYTLVQGGEQSSNIGIGSDPFAIDNTVDAFASNNVTVKVQAKGARDPDGAISYFIWYYYPVDDPVRREGFKITPGDTPFATFVIPKPSQARQYAFAVEIVDNDELKVNSIDIAGQGATLIFPPDDDAFDIPIVTLKVDKYIVKAGEEVTFTTVAKTLSERPDFEGSRYFKYDFDGDGLYEIQSTREPKVTHVYTKPGLKKPKVSVYYRGRAGVGTTEDLTVLKALTPRFSHVVKGNTLLMRDFSVGEIIKKEFCADEIACNAGESGVTYGTDQPVVHTYDTPGNYAIKLEIKDEFGNIQTAKRSITIEENDDPISILTIPEAIPNENGTEYTIDVTSATNYEVDFLLQSPRYCSMDIDITSSDVGDPSQDEDLACGIFKTFTFFPQATTQHGVIRYNDNGVAKEISVTFSFPEIEDTLDEKYVRARDKINEIVSDLDDTQQQVKTYLLNLKNSLGELAEMSSIIINLRDYLANRSTLLTEKQEIDIIQLLQGLDTKESQQAQGGTPYDQSKAEILAWYVGETKDTLKKYFAEFENSEGNIEEKKSILEKIINEAKSSFDRGNNDEVDFNSTLKELCNIMVYNEIPSKICGNDFQSEDTASENTEKVKEPKGKRTVIQKILRIFLRVVIILLVVIVGIIAVFAIKAKKQNNEENEDDDE